MIPVFVYVALIEFSGKMVRLGEHLFKVSKCNLSGIINGREKGDSRRIKKFSGVAG